ncbi:hypothetical protein QQF64_014559 [Cirrhinus molitorella]|uniref:Uncharacterized protein n=1 Tax=Cirrhinus molitorella TaxID=172907 RepID=A0ABR3NSH0_9TELE
MTGACGKYTSLGTPAIAGTFGMFMAGTFWDLLYWCSREYWNCVVFIQKTFVVEFRTAMRCSHYRNFWDPWAYITWSIWDSHLRMDRGMNLSEWSLLEPFGPN